MNRMEQAGNRMQGLPVGLDWGGLWTGRSASPSRDSRGGRRHAEHRDTYGGRPRWRIGGITRSSFRGSAKVFSYEAEGCRGGVSESAVVDAKALEIKNLSGEVSVRQGWREAC